jgi:hypothetical protein
MPAESAFVYAQDFKLDSEWTGPPTSGAPRIRKQSGTTHHPPFGFRLGLDSPQRTTLLKP